MERNSNKKRCTDKNGKILFKSLGWCLAIIAASVLIYILLLYEEDETSSAMTTWSVTYSKVIT